MIHLPLPQNPQSSGASPSQPPEQRRLSRTTPQSSGASPSQPPEQRRLFPPEPPEQRRLSLTTPQSRGASPSQRSRAAAPLPHNPPEQRRLSLTTPQSSGASPSQPPTAAAPLPHNPLEQRRLSLTPPQSSGASPSQPPEQRRLSLTTPHSSGASPSQPPRAAAPLPHKHPQQRRLSLTTPPEQWRLSLRTPESSGASPSQPPKAVAPLPHNPPEQRRLSLTTPQSSGASPSQPPEQRRLSLTTPSSVPYGTTAYHTRTVVGQWDCETVVGDWDCGTVMEQRWDSGGTVGQLVGLWRHFHPVKVINATCGAWLGTQLIDTTCASPKPQPLRVLPLPTVLSGDSSAHPGMPSQRAHRLDHGLPGRVLAVAPARGAAARHHHRSAPQLPPPHGPPAVLHLPATLRLLARALLQVAKSGSASMPARLAGGCIRAVCCEEEAETEAEGRGGPIAEQRHGGKGREAEARVGAEGASAGAEAARDASLPGHFDLLPLEHSWGGVGRETVGEPARGVEHAAAAAHGVTLTALCLCSAAAMAS
ncbi:unnamed protein product [Closterium sp. Yama58-4]|nr:unnamed protein product [Closterium sp. Yama58-4]